MMIDGNGNPCCGQSFMGGTICTMMPGHEGGHSAQCQGCDGDWINQTCVCFEYCKECGTMFNDTKKTRYCQDCRCGQSNEQCELHWQHVDDGVPCRPGHESVEPVTDEEIAEVFGLSLPLPEADL